MNISISSVYINIKKKYLSNSTIYFVKNLYLKSSSTLFASNISENNIKTNDDASQEILQNKKNGV